jgi:hypothetical protein
MTQVTGEVLTLTGQICTLAFTPVGSVAIYCNGLRQKQGLDYNASGPRVFSEYWKATDVLLCDYQHA